MIFQFVEMHQYLDRDIPKRKMIQLKWNGRKMIQLKWDGGNIVLKNKLRLHAGFQIIL